MDQLIIILLVISAIGAAVVAIMEPVLGLVVLIGRYLHQLWRGPLPEDKL